MNIAIEELKEKYHTNYPDKSEFAKKARLLQSIWREENDIPLKRKYGNQLSHEQASAELNFLTPAIRKIVRDEISENQKPDRKEKKVISKNRMYENLLSSQPLAFNLFGELSLNSDLASKVFDTLFPEKKIEVTKIQFEHSPGRKKPEYLNDNSAFDVFVEYNGKNEKGFIGIEVKYAEVLYDKPASNEDKKYNEVAVKSGLFTDKGLEELNGMPVGLEQIWRDHLLALSIIQHKDYDEGFFVYLYPKDNKRCSDCLNEYFNKLKSQTPDTNFFHPLEMEKLVDTIKQHASADWINKFYDRYLNFEKIKQYEQT